MPPPPPRAPPEAGDGIRSARATNLFRMVNFELYVKPNLVVMGVGLTCLGFSTAYLAYLNAAAAGGDTYVAIGEDGRQTRRTKSTGWN